jgi:hypothetical protein
VLCRSTCLLDSVLGLLAGLLDGALGLLAGLIKLLL